MSLKQHYNSLFTFRLVKVFILLILMVIAQHAFAQGDCGTDASNGYSIGQLCKSRTDANGNYIGSFCIQDATDDPFSNYHADCLQSYDQGQAVCTGSTCQGSGSQSGGGGCTDHGVCEDDFDCCGLNWCDQDLHRCQDWDSGPRN
jgi:hypothetical protein